MCVRLWVAVTASHRFVLKLLRQRAFSKQSVVVGLCVCVHLWVAVTASLRFVLKLLRQHTFSKQVATGCVCVCAFMGCCDSILQVKSIDVFFSFLGAVAAVVALRQYYLTYVKRFLSCVCTV